MLNTHTKSAINELKLDIYKGFFNLKFSQIFLTDERTCDNKFVDQEVH